MESNGLGKGHFLDWQWTAPRQKPKWRPEAKLRLWANRIGRESAALIKASIPT
jgi:hypothetical protein